MTSPQAPFPVRLTGELDPDVGRWQWLFKWLLAIPHFVVLFFLWIGLVLSTVVAGFAILFTGRYPRFHGRGMVCLGGRRGRLALRLRGRVDRAARALRRTRPALHGSLPPVALRLRPRPEPLGLPSRRLRVPDDRRLPAVPPRLRQHRAAADRRHSRVSACSAGPDRLDDSGSQRSGGPPATPGKPSERCGLPGPRVQSSGASFVLERRLRRLRPLTPTTMKTAKPTPATATATTKATTASLMAVAA